MTLKKRLDNIPGVVWYDMLN